MKAIFDTSVLVAAFLTGHPNHLTCLPYLQQAQSGQLSGAIATHSLAEGYAVLTRMPNAGISPAFARQLLTDNIAVFERVPLDAGDYQAAIDLMVACNLPGGGIYDALLAQAAIKASADMLLTLNPKHFTRLGANIAGKVRTP